MDDLEVWHLRIIIIKPQQTVHELQQTRGWNDQIEEDADCTTRDQVRTPRGSDLNQVEDAGGEAGNKEREAPVIRHS